MTEAQRLGAGMSEEIKKINERLDRIKTNARLISGLNETQKRRIAELEAEVERLREGIKELASPNSYQFDACDSAWVLSKAQALLKETTDGE